MRTCKSERNGCHGGKKSISKYRRKHTPDQNRRIEWIVEYLFRTMSTQVVFFFSYLKSKGKKSSKEMKLRWKLRQAKKSWFQFSSIIWVSALCWHNSIQLAFALEISLKWRIANTSREIWNCRMRKHLSKVFFYSLTFHRQMELFRPQS